jgi:hypothetical protein
MKIKLAITSIIVFLLAIAFIGTALAQTANVGVNPGNTVDYSYKINWASTDPTATVPAQYVELNNTQFIRLHIINVEDTQINVNFVRHYNNGTETTQNGNINVNTQVLEVPYSVMIIRSHANPEEKIYPVGGHATLSGTSTRTYPIGQIETIRYVYSHISSTSDEETEIFYDRANGVGLEYNWALNETSGSYFTTTKETLLLTSMTVSTSPTTSLTPLSSVEPALTSSATPNTGEPLQLTGIIAVLIVSIIIVLVAYATFRKKRNTKTYPLLNRSLE